MNHYSYNGKIYPPGKEIIAAGNRGLRYGDGLFETMRVKQGNIFSADEHFARLWKGMELLGFQPPSIFTPLYLQNCIEAVLQKNGHTENARIRLSVFRGEGGLYDAQNHYPNHIIESWALPPMHGQWNSNGLDLGIYESARKSCDVLANIKHNNFLPYVLAALEAKKNKWNDAIILNQYGRICDSTVANVFLVKDKAIVTPSLEEGCIAGVARKLLLRALKTARIPVSEQAVTTADLQNADEVFITNAIHPIRWVKSIGDKAYVQEESFKIYTSVIPTIY